MVLWPLKIKKLNLKKSTWKWSIKEQVQNLKTHLPKAKKQFNQLELKDLDLFKQAAEILASRLNEKHVLYSSTKVPFYKKKRDKLFLPYFKEEKQLVYCDNVPGLLGELGIPSQKSGDFFWTAPSAVLSMYFYTMGIGMELFLLVTPLY